MNLKQYIAVLATGLFVPQLLAAAKPAPEEAPQPTIVKNVPAEQQGGQPLYMTLKGLHGIDAQKDDTGAARNIEAGGPWIGVQFGPIPKPLRAHLNLDDKAGQMVLNVAEGSPADAAGLQQYDVITNIDGRDASVDMAEFLDLIRSFAPNQTHQFGVIRAGSPLTQRVIVGSRPADWNNLKYKYEMEEEPMAGSQLFQRGGMLEKDPSGNWLFKNFDQTKDMQDIWRYMPKFDPKDLQFTWQRALPGGQNQMQVYVDKGNEIRIEHGEDGKITVTKKDHANNDESTTTTTYEDEAAFEKADPDTFKTYKNGFGAAGNLGFFYGMKPNGQFGPNQQPFNLQFDAKELHEAAEAMKKEAEESQRQADVLREQLNSEMGQKSGASVQTRSTSTSYDVGADGSVRVVTRTGDTEVVRQFSSVEQMKTANPELYEKYENALSAGKE